MPLECELKFLQPNFVLLRDALQKNRATRIAQPYFEKNIVFDDQKRSLKKQGILLRLRHKNERDTLLTVKRPLQEKNSGDYKKLLEHQVSTTNFEATQNLLVLLGYDFSFSYEKIREKWKWHGLSICLDILPFGDFIEMEGEEAMIAQATQLFALSQLTQSTASYHELNAKWRRQNKLAEDENFLFSKEQKMQFENTLENQSST